MIDVVYAQSNERCPENEREHVRPSAYGEHRRRRHKKSARKRGDKRQDEPRRPEKPHAERDDDDERDGGEYVDLKFRALRRHRRVEGRPAHIRLHGKAALLRVRVERLNALEHIADERAVGRLEPVEHKQSVTMSFLLAHGVAVAERPSVVVPRLKVREVVRCQQVRILLHGDQRREETRDERRRGGLRHLVELPGLQLRARPVGQEAAAARRKRGERLAERPRLRPRMWAHAFPERRGGRVERSEVRPLQKDAELPSEVVRKRAQHALPGGVEQRIEIRLHAVAARVRKRGDCRRDAGDERAPSDF